MFGREMDMYYESSMGNVDKEIQDIMSRASELDVDTSLSGEGSQHTRMEDLTKDCLDDKEKID